MKQDYAGPTGMSGGKQNIPFLVSVVLSTHHVRLQSDAKLRKRCCSVSIKSKQNFAEKKTDECCVSSVFFYEVALEYFSELT